MASRSGQQRASGETQALEVAEDQAKEFDETPTVDLDVDRQRMFESMGFSRMRLDWRGDDKQVVQRALAAVDGRIEANFGDAYRIMFDLYSVVREPLVDEATGVVQTSPTGLPLWKRLPSGAYAEDWTRLTARQKEDFLFRLTTRLFEWEQAAAESWVEAMLAKGQWTEKFAIEYDKPMNGTIDDRTARGNQHSADERYFAIFLGGYSRRADAVVRSMERLSLRLKDTL